MAKKELSFREIASDILNGASASVYILMGEESYWIDKLVELFEQHVIAPEERDFNSYVYYGADARLDVVVATAQQFPVMAERQLVILKEAQAMERAKTQLEKIEPYLRHPNPKTVFVIVFKGENLNLTSKVMKTAVANGAIIFKSDKLRDYQIPAAIKDYCTSEKIAIDEKAIAMLSEYIGTDLSRLFGEIDKLIVANAGKKKITAEIIEENVGISKEYNNFELVKALSTKDFPKAMRIVEFFRKNMKTNPLIVTIGTLFTFFSKLTIASLLRDKSDASLMTELQIKSTYSLREIRDGLRNYNPNQSIQAIKFIRDADLKSKGIDSFQKEEEILRELVYNLLRL